jgi:hypothetical protein
MPLAYSSSFFVRIDELFRLPPSISLTCAINTTANVACRRVRPNLLFVGNSVAHAVNCTTMLTVSTLVYFDGELYDTEEVHFSMFINGSVPNTPNSLILYGSHEHMKNPISIYALTIPEALIWRIPNNPYFSVVHVVYVGYFGPPVVLTTTLNSYFK